jgi:hypothetical protein
MKREVHRSHFRYGMNPYIVSVQKRGFLFEIKACKKFYRRCPAGNALGVHIVDIPRIKF